MGLDSYLSIIKINLKLVQVYHITVTSHLLSENGFNVQYSCQNSKFLQFEQNFCISLGTFEAVPDIQSIILEDNNIEILDEGSLPMFATGAAYFFSGNKISDVAEGAFYDGKALKCLHDNILNELCIFCATVDLIEAI